MGWVHVVCDHKSTRTAIACRSVGTHKPTVCGCKSTTAAVACGFCGFYPCNHGLWTGHHGLPGMTGTVPSRNESQSPCCPPQELGPRCFDPKSTTAAVACGFVGFIHKFMACGMTIMAFLGRQTQCPLAMRVRVRAVLHRSRVHFVVAIIHGMWNGHHGLPGKTDTVPSRDESQSPCCPPQESESTLLP